MLPSGVRSGTIGSAYGTPVRPMPRPAGQRMSAVPPLAPAPAVAREIFPGLTNTLVGLYALMLTVPIAEILIIYFHAHVSVVVIADVLLTLLLIVSGNLGRFFETPMGKPWMAVGVLYMFASVFGIYKGGSVPFMFQYLIRFHVVPIYFCALTLTPPDVRRALRWIAWGMLLLVVLCAKFGMSEEGRFFLPDTSLSNPNDLAFALLFGMGCLILNKSILSRLAALGTCVIMLYFVLKTASRANLLTLIAMLVVLFILAPRRAKLALGLAVPVVAAVLIAMTPSFALMRLSLIVPHTSATLNDIQLANAVGSAEARTELQQRAIALTIQHPLFGVGAKQFQNGVENMVRAATGQKSGWQGAHNTYLEVAAENGIPAAILYCLTLFYCARMNIRTYKLCRSNPLLAHAATQSLALILMTMCFLVCVAFSNNAYDPRVGVLIGMSAANFLAVRDEMRRHDAASHGVPTITPPPAPQQFRGAPRARLSPV